MGQWHWRGQRDTDCPQHRYTLTQHPKKAPLCLCPLTLSTRWTWNNTKSTHQITRQSRISKAQVEVDAQTLWWPPPGVNQIKWHHQAKKLSFHTGFPSNSTGWRSEGPLCLMEHKPLWTRALSREGCKFCKHWKPYLCPVYTKKNKKLHWQAVKLLVWFNLYFSLQIACLYWLVLWNQQYSFWTATIPRITQLLHHAKQEASQHIQSTRTQLLTNPCPDTASGFCWDKHQSQTIFEQSLKTGMLAIKLQVSFYCRNAASAEFGGITGPD